MAPTKSRKSILSEKNTRFNSSTSTIGYNNDYFRTLSNSKRRKSFKDTLRRTKQKIIDLNQKDTIIVPSNENTIVWQTFPTRNSKEFDLEQKIDLEIKMREGTTKLLAACHHPSQTLEAAKSLLTSNERMTAYLEELQLRKTQLQQQEEDSKTLSPCVQLDKCCMAKVSVADIRMPLIWKDTDHFKNKGDYRRFAVFCLLRIGTEIYDTSMITQVDRSMTDISFEESFVFCQVPPDFEFHLEVYSNVLQDDLSIASTPCKIKHKINDSLSRTVGRKLAATVKDELSSSNLGPKFELVAKATLKLDDANDYITTHDLTLENSENRFNQLPLFGHFCCRLAAQPEMLTEDGTSGSLTVQKKLDQSGQHLWASRRGIQVSFWSSAEMANCNCPALFTIPLSKASSVELISLKTVYVHIKYFEDHVLAERYLRGDTTEQTNKWFHELQATIRNSVSWKHAAEQMMEIQSPLPRRTPLFSITRKGSLYDETPLKMESKRNDSEVYNSNTRSTVSPPALRMRSRSSSICSSTSSSGSSNGTRSSLFGRQSSRQRLSCHETNV